jgi:hypothetical protein
MAFSTEEKGSPYDFDYKIFFSKLMKLVHKSVWYQALFFY